MGSALAADADRVHDRLPHGGGGGRTSWTSLRFSPPSFLVTTKVAAMSHWLVRVGGRGGALYLVVALATA